MVAVVKKIVIMYDNCFFAVSVVVCQGFQRVNVCASLETCPAMHFRNMDVLSLNNYEYTKKEKVPLFFLTPLQQLIQIFLSRIVKFQHMLCNYLAFTVVLPKKAQNREIYKDYFVYQSLFCDIFKIHAQIPILLTL